MWARFRVLPLQWKALETLGVIELGVSLYQGVETAAQPRLRAKRPGFKSSAEGVRGGQPFEDALEGPSTRLQVYSGTPPGIGLFLTLLEASGELPGLSRHIPSHCRPRLRTLSLLCKRLQGGPGASHNQLIGE